MSKIKTYLVDREDNILDIDDNGNIGAVSYHADGTAGQLITGIDYVSGKSGIDSSTETLQVIEYDHHEIHSGSHYTICDYADLAINSVFDMQWTTPNTTKWAHFTYNLSCEAETEWIIYEGATINVAGTTVTPINNNRNSANTSGMTIATISNTSLALANADTAVAGATLLERGIVGARRSGGITSRSGELVLKQNTIYCFRSIANAAGYVNFCVDFYEHTNKN